jgi:hypothetical protein
MSKSDQGYIDSKAAQIQEQYGTKSVTKHKPAPFQRERITVKKPGAKFYVPSELRVGDMVRPWDREDFFEVLSSLPVSGSYRRRWMVVMLEYGGIVEERGFTEFARFEMSNEHPRRSY